MVQRPFEEFQSRLAELFETSPARDLERNLKSLLTSAFIRMDLVTREEFDIQVKLLSRAREKLIGLEARVAALEAKLGVAVDPAHPGDADAFPGQKPHG